MIDDFMPTTPKGHTRIPLTEAQLEALAKRMQRAVDDLKELVSIVDELFPTDSGKQRPLSGPWKYYGDRGDQ